MSFRWLTSEEKTAISENRQFFRYYADQYKNTHVKIDLVNKKIVRLKVKTANMPNRAENIWQLECSIISDCEEWQFEEVHTTMQAIIPKEWEARRTLFLQQINAQ